VGYKYTGGKHALPEIYGSIFGLFGRPYPWLNVLHFGFYNSGTNETQLRLSTTVVFHTETFGLTLLFAHRIRNLHQR
jgi:hypothetical protein